MEILEILFIFGILILVFGPTKLPKIARDLGNAVHEFRKSSSGIIKSSPIDKSDNDKESILNIAKKLQIEIEGKNIKQISDEILTKINNDKE
ncbi:MAG: twin-arginine translocase TatA/TatE family subunit [Candidatus Bathyarchaeota archaeon]|nr:MAG: twin-arginine translocase TatA/TatE family subunit [Candidatus Bathyarchaeota archaeon]